MNCYCLYCESVKCENIIELLPKMLPCKALYPVQIQHTWSKGSEVDRRRALLPGYVFVYMEDKPAEYRQLRSPIGVLSVLENVDGSHELKGSDRDFAMMLLDKDGTIGKTRVYYEGEIMKICKGSFSGKEARIIKVDNRNHRIKVEIPFTSITIKTWLEFEEASV